MKRKPFRTTQYAFLLMLLAACKFSNAQQLDIFGGISMTGLNHKIAGTTQDNSGYINIHYGMGVMVPFKPKAFRADDGGSGLFPSLQFVKKGASKSSVVGPTLADVKLGYLQLNVPIYYLSGNYGIGFGPYAAYAVSGTKKNRTGNTDTQKIVFGTDINSFDYGLSLECKLSIFKMQYDLGLANIGAGTNGTVKTRSFSLGLAIPLVRQD